jgi:fucose 4-O-acetylase-like acetyltransferase
MTGTAAIATPGDQSTAAHGRRNDTVDVAKGLGIFLVVLGHNAMFRTTLHVWYEAVYLFHVPLFFFLSGVTFKPASLQTIASKRLRTLLVPYFAMSLVSVAAAVVAEGPLAAGHVAVGVLYGTGHTLRFTPLWFLPCLFVVTLAATAAVQLARPGCADPADARTPRILAALGIASAVLGLGVISSGRFATPPFQDEQGRPLGLPWSLDLAPVALGVFIAGMLCARSRIVWQHRHPLLLVAVPVLVLAFLASRHISVDLNYRRVTDPLAAVIGMATGIALVIGASALIVRGRRLVRPIAHLGSASLVVLIFHGPLQRRVLEWLGSWSLPQPLAIVLGTGLTIAMICAADLLVLRRVTAFSWIYYPQQRWQS